MSGERAMAKTRIQRVAGFCAIAAVCSFALFTFSHNKADVDLWGNVGFVKALPGSDAFLRTNTFSYTEPLHEWVNHEWLSEYIFNRTYHAFGNPGLLLLKVALGFILLGILYTAMRDKCKSPTLRFLYLILTISTIGYGFSTRPHLFTYIFTAALLSAVLRERVSHISAAAALPLGCVWANLHGAFFSGELILLTALAVHFTRSLAHKPGASRNSVILAISAVLFFAGTILNPYGIKLWNFVFESAAITRTILSEWAPFNPIENFYDHIDFIVLAGITLAAFAVSFKSSSFLQVFFTAVALAAAFGMRRNIPTFAIVAAITAAPALYHAFGEALDGFTQKISPIFTVLTLSAFTAVSLAFTVQRNLVKPMQVTVDRTEFPVDAVNFIKVNHIKSNAIVFFDWAELCEWHLFPDVRVFMDGRFRSAYSRNCINDYLDFIYSGKKRLNAITNYPTDMVFVHTGNPCVKTMLQQKDWSAVYRDNISVIFVKNSVHTNLLDKIKSRSVNMPAPQKQPTFP